MYLGIKRKEPQYNIFIHYRFVKFISLLFTHNKISIILVFTNHQLVLVVDLIFLLNLNQKLLRFVILQDSNCMWRNNFEIFIFFEHTRFSQQSFKRLSRPMHDVYYVFSIRARLKNLRWSSWADCTRSPLWSYRVPGTTYSRSSCRWDWAPPSWFH